MDTVNAVGSGTFSYRILENTATVSRSRTFGVFGSSHAVTVIQTGTSHRTRFDYDGDGKADVSVYRPSNGVWYLQNSSNGFGAMQFGISTDTIVPADYDGDGKTDVAVFRPESGNWYQMKSTQGFGAVQFGTNGDKPIPNAFVP